LSQKEQRIKEELQLIRTQNGISIKNLGILVDVAEITARRDVEEMVRRQLVRNIRGTIFYNFNAKDNEGYMLGLAETRALAEKKRIGAFAASLLSNGESCIIDNGTTTEQLAASIPVNYRGTILCYNINVLNLLYWKPNIDLIFGGGSIYRQTLMFASPQGQEMIRTFRANKSFISAAGATENLGVTCASEYEVPYKHESLKSSQEKILLMDSSKFGKLQPCFVGNFEDFDMIVTDTGLPGEWREFLKTKDVELVLV